MTDFLEPKIKPLVEALNLWEGVKTFSSCEGHEGTDEPHVTFICSNEESLTEILNKLEETSWKIILNDMATNIKGAGMHYTLRYAPIGFYVDLEDLKEVQKEITEIAELLSKESSKSEAIEDNFPVLKCKECGKEQFTIEGFLEFNLSYHYRGKLPQLEVDMGSNIMFQCWECREELELKDPVSELTDLLQRGTVK